MSLASSTLNELKPALTFYSASVISPALTQVNMATPPEYIESDCGVLTFNGTTPVAILPNP